MLGEILFFPVLCGAEDRIVSEKSLLHITRNPVNRTRQIVTTVALGPLQCPTRNKQCRRGQDYEQPLLTYDEERNIIEKEDRNTGQPDCLLPEIQRAWIEPG